MSNANPIRMAAKFYDIRDHVKRVLGDKYSARMAEGGKLLTGIAEQKGCGILEVALNVCQSAKRAGDENQIPFIIAAAVELLEPSEVQT